MVHASPLGVKQEIHMEERKVIHRPGRKLGAERRRVAREILRRFYDTDTFAFLPSEVRLAMLELCPEEDIHAASLKEFPTSAEAPQENAKRDLRLVSSWG